MGPVSAELLGALIALIGAACGFAYGLGRAHLRERVNQQARDHLEEILDDEQHFEKTGGLAARIRDALLRRRSRE